MTKPKKVEYKGQEMLADTRKPKNPAPETAPEPAKPKPPKPSSSPAPLSAPEAALVEASDHEPATKPITMVLNGLEYKCRSQLPPAVIPEFLDLLGQAQQGGESGPANLRLMKGVYLFVHDQIIVKEHRQALHDRFYGADHIEPDEWVTVEMIMNAVTDIIPHYSGQSTPKR